METHASQTARRAAQVYFEYRTALAEMLKSIPDPAEARSIAHDLAVQIAAHEALHAEA